MIHVKNKVISYLSIVLVALSFMTGCAKEPKYHVEKIDTNQDGQVDIIRYLEGDKKVKEYIDYLNGIYKAETLYWDKRGYLLKVVTEYKTEKPFISFYKKGIAINQNGKSIIRQELDNYKTYKNIAEKRWLKSYKGKSYLYTVNGRVLYTTLDPKNDGRLVSVVFYDKYGRISKSFEDKNRTGKFDILELYSFGKLEVQKKIYIPTDSQIEYLEQFNG